MSIARAVYADADIYVFDDPLSALDAHVTADVFRQCIKERLRGKTRLLVSNQMHLMADRAVDRIVVMKAGRIAQVRPRSCDAWPRVSTDRWLSVGNMWASGGHIRGADGGREG